MPPRLLTLLAAGALWCAALPRPAVARCCPAQRTATLHALNAVRAAHGEPPLVLDRRLGRAARRHSREMVVRRYFAHESPDGARFSARMLWPRVCIIRP